MPRPPLGPLRPMPAWLIDLLERLGITVYRNYTVQIVNGTSSTTFGEVDVFYKRVGLPGIVFLTEAAVAPGETRYFNLGPCKEMESYVVGFFINDELVAQIPPAGMGNMTPQLASQFKPSDVDQCADGWLITD